MGTLVEKKKEFEKLFLTGKYTQQEIAKTLSLSRVTIGKWTKENPVSTYMQIRKRLAKELDRLSQKPQGNEELIFKYIDNLGKLDTMIRKGKYLPK
ncbi:MAG: hypothetical protein R3Y49_03305 [Rikenellaceae bacterium]